ncbi:hypothetical protein EVAR_59867_1 [Eumeta japonica]|uniref:Uncharacterized protein n=1 Tax=Eumeta variegata TaxID=151549 RepID=A0A4C1XLR5_EUMVA|nr:hypothetical protein EVAR_59867_1 [Eumeta japonica]
MKVPDQDLYFLKRLEVYETVDNFISKAALNKFSQHLWYSSEEITVRFDDEVNEQTKRNIVVNLQRESLDDSGNRYIPLKDVSDYFYVQRQSKPTLKSLDSRRPPLAKTSTIGQCDHASRALVSITECSIAL